MQRLVGFLQPLLLRSPPRASSLEAGDLLTLLQAGARAAHLGRRDREELARMVTGSVGDLVDAWFESDAVKAVWASTGVIGAWAGPRTPGTAYNLLYHAVGRIDRIGGLWGHVRGGMGAISEAIAASARAAGAEIRTSAIVRSLHVAAGSSARRHPRRRKGAPCADRPLQRPPAYDDPRPRGRGSFPRRGCGRPPAPAHPRGVGQDQLLALGAALLRRRERGRAVDAATHRGGDLRLGRAP